MPHIQVGRAPASWHFTMAKVILGEWKMVMGPVPLNENFQLEGLIHSTGGKGGGAGRLQLVITLPTDQDALFQNPTPSLGEVSPPPPFGLGGSGGDVDLENQETSPIIYDQTVKSGAVRPFSWTDDGRRVSLSMMPGARVWSRVITGQADHRVIVQGWRGLVINRDDVGA